MTAALMILSLVLALLFGARFLLAPPSWAGTWTKAGSVAALAALGPVLGVSPLVTLGLALGALGDFCLSRPGERAFLAGMAAFALGHLAYAWAFWQGTAPPILPALAVIALALSTEVWLAPFAGPMRWPVRGYAVVIALMALSVLTVGLGAPLLTLGAALFLLSDVLLALDLFTFAGRPTPRPWLKRAVWAIYWAGQVQILWGAAGVSGA